MPSPLIQDINLVEPLDIQQAFVFLSDEVMDLQMVDNFLLAVERRYLQNTDVPFDPARIRANLRMLDNFAGELPYEKFNRIVNEIRNGVADWKRSLGERDAAVQTYHLRQFCDEPGRRIEPVVFSALTRFYRELPASDTNQSKFDLSITRLFSKSPNPPFREMLIERDGLSEQIAALFEGWDFDSPAKKEVGHASLIAAKLDDFRREALAFADYQELLSSDLFDRLRAFKRKLGTLYLHPEIAAAAIECNISVGNGFNKVLSKANESIDRRVRSGLDLGGAFYDASPGAERVISEILTDLRAKSAEVSDSESPSSASIDDILSLVCEGSGVFREAGRAISKDIGRAGDFRELNRPTLPTAQKRLEPIFFSLSQPEPDLSKIRKHISAFGALSDIDLKDFIGEPKDPNDHLCRNVFGVMLWIEELCDNELNGRGDMSSQLRDELHRLLRRSEEFSEQLDYLVRESSGESQNRLLIVSNRLLESRLKLKRGIARFTRRNLEIAADTSHETDSSFSENLEPAGSGPAITVSGPTNKWLVVATLLVSLLSGAIYFFDQQMSRFIPVAKDVEVLDTERLPRGEHLSQGFKKGGLMMITAKNSWATLPKEEQRRNLEELKKFPGKTPVTTVMITDTSGRVLADISEDGIRILGTLQIADTGAPMDVAGSADRLIGVEKKEGGASVGPDE